MATTHDVLQATASGAGVETAALTESTYMSDNPVTLVYSVAVDANVVTFSDAIKLDVESVAEATSNITMRLPSYMSWIMTGAPMLAEMSTVIEAMSSGFFVFSTSPHDP